MQAVEKVFAENPGIDCVIQFAAYKAVGESVSKPIEYYSNNLNCTLNILDVMRRIRLPNIIFSSSATVYGAPASVPSARISLLVQPPTRMALPRCLPSAS